MIVYYNLTTKKILRTEDNTQIPLIPFNKNLDEKKTYYKSINEGFVTIDEELGAKILNYALNFDTNDNFIGIKGVI